MGNAPAGHKLGSEATTIDEARQEVLSLRIENRTRLSFVLESADPPELKEVLPQTLGSSCSLDLDKSTLSAGCHAIYSSTEVSIGSGGPTKEYDMIGRFQGKDKAVATAFDLRSSKMGHFFTVVAGMSSRLSSSFPYKAPLLACSLEWKLPDEAHEVASLQNSTSQEGQIGSCSWRVYPSPGDKGFFSADVRVTNTDSKTMQMRKGLLDALSQPGAQEEKSQETASVANQSLDSSPRGLPSGLHVGSSCRLFCSKRTARDGSSPDIRAPTTDEELCRTDARTASTMPGISDRSECGVTEDVILPAPSDDDGVASSDDLPVHLPAEDAVMNVMQASSSSGAQDSRKKRSGGAGATSLGLDGRCRGNKSAAIAIQTKAEMEQPKPETGIRSRLVAEAEARTQHSSGVVDGHEAEDSAMNSSQISQSQDSKRTRASGAGTTALGLDGRCRGNKSAMIAIQAKAEMEQRRLAEAQQRKEEEAEREFKRTFGQVVANQDAEFEIGLLHDQLNSLQKENVSLKTEIKRLESSLEDASQLHHNVQMRLERYGENPKLRAEAEKAEQAEIDLQQPLAEARERLLVVEADIAEKEELLALAAITDDL